MTVSATGSNAGSSTGATRPQPGPPRDYRFPFFERITLDNGLGVIVAPVRKLPIVSAVLTVDAGAASEPPGAYGVAQLTAQMLLEGTRSRNGDALSEQFERWVRQWAPRPIGTQRCSP